MSKSFEYAKKATAELRDRLLRNERERLEIVAELDWLAKVPVPASDPIAVASVAVDDGAPAQTTRQRVLARLALGPASADEILKYVNGRISKPATRNTLSSVLAKLKNGEKIVTKDELGRWVAVLTPDGGRLR